MRARLLIIGALVVGGLFVFLDNETNAPEGAIVTDQEQLAQAMCADLRDGFSLFQMHAQGVEHYRETGRSEESSQLAAARIEDLATREYCPEFRSAFEATFTYETWIK